MARKLKLLTKAEAAEYMRISTDTVEHLIKLGILPAYRISKTCYRIDETDLDEYLESRRTRFAAIPSAVKMKEIKAKQRINALPCSYVPGMKVVDPNA